MAKLQNISRKQLNTLAELLHQCISFTALSVYYSIEHIQNKESTKEIIEKNTKILQGIIDTANTLYKDLTPKQKKLLRDEVKDFLQLSSIL